MKIAVLSGAIKNAGDFLIKERCKKILEFVYKDCEVIEFAINYSLERDLDEINSQDLLIVPGGPVSRNEYPKCIPLVPDLTKITTPMIGIGLGWYGKLDNLKEIYSYHFVDKTIDYLHKLQNGNAISCRDWHTVRVMRNNGMGKAIMTGCPAWYDLDYVDLIGFKNNLSIPYKKICISDPAREENKKFILPLIEYLQKKYPDCKLHYVFHRGIEKDSLTNKKVGNSNKALKQQLEKQSINVHDISYSVDGMSIYNDCDLHIGFRVHAHIYNLSHRTPTILIEEDGRGSGVNQALGLEGISAHENAGSSCPLRVFSNETRTQYLIQSLEDVLLNIEELNYKQFEFAFEKMRYYFDSMVEYVKKIQELL